MESNTVDLTPEQLELVKFGSLASEKLRRLYFNSVKRNTDDASSVNPTTSSIDYTDSNLTDITNDTKIDFKLNLDLNNYLNTDYKRLVNTNGRSLTDSLYHKSPTCTSTLTKNNNSRTANVPPEYKRPNGKNDIDKEWSSISEAEPTHTALREWKSIQLRGFVDPKRFYKNMKNKLEEIPKNFQIGKIINQPTGINVNNLDRSTNSTSHLNNKRRVRKKPSLITSMLKEDKGWVNKRYNQIQAEKTKGSKGWYQRQLKKRKRG